MKNKFGKLAVLALVFQVLVWIFFCGLSVAMGYIAIHFIQKYW